ncbi:MAG: maa protein [Osedax symbiont Rs1]|nr:MAG: maa protein [Osedax symbiont Rs1]
MKNDQQKMLDGEAYNPLCKELRKQRSRAKALCFEYNRAHPDQKGKKQQILSKLLNSVNKAVIEANFYCDYGYNITLGSNFYANHNCTILDPAPVVIGNNVMFGPNVNLSTATHPLNAEERATGSETAQPIYIEDNVWIGMGVQILAGVTIGKNSVIAAGAVVNKSIPSNSLAAGVPAKVIKNLT